MIGDLIATIAGLNGPELKTYDDPEAIAEPGFYVTSDMTRIEHWSYPCEYTKPMSHAPHSAAGLLCDGFLSIISGDDAGEICEKLNNWHQHLVKYGVIAP
jgi:hypothetical protein